MNALVVGSRGSPLALAQTRLVIAALQRSHPELKVDLRIIRTEGDRLADEPGRPADTPLAKGLFTVALEQALLAGEIDLAVHSLKDLPTTGTPGLHLAAIPARADARDLLITRGATLLADLPHGAQVATGSPRRAAQLTLARADLRIVPVRGNIDTRLRKFRENGNWTALILAEAGLERLRPDTAGLTLTPLPLALMLPAPGQGALALQTADGRDALAELLAPLHDPATAAAVNAERAFLHALGGGCLQPIAALGRVEGDNLHLDGIAWLDGDTPPRRGNVRGEASAPEAVGQRLAEELNS